MVKNFDSTAGVARKLILKNKEPYVIEKILKNYRYLIKDIDGFSYLETHIRVFGV